jgi:hypothetical protein
MSDTFYVTSRSVAGISGTQTLAKFMKDQSGQFVLKADGSKYVVPADFDYNKFIQFGRDNSLGGLKSEVHHRALLGRVVI